MQQIVKQHKTFNTKISAVTQTPLRTKFVSNLKCIQVRDNL